MPTRTWTRLVPLAIAGGSPRASSSGRLIAEPLEAAAFRKPQSTPAASKANQVAITPPHWFQDATAKPHRFISATAYVAGVVVVNVGFSLGPQLDWLWSLLVGGVLALRDGAQRSWGYAVLVWMLLGAGLSYGLGNPAVALASAVAFLISESIDWVVFTWTRRPFADRV